MPSLWKSRRTQDDSDALAFISAAGLTDTTQKNSIHFLVGALKWAGLWSKMLAVYPLVGAAATPHSKDLKATYNITWSGTITHDANGITGNGSSGYGNTGINANSVVSLNSSHLSVYSRTNHSGDTGAIGCLTTTPNKFYILPRWSDGKFYFANGSASDDGIAIDNSLGFMCSSRISSTSVVGFKNGRKILPSSRASSSNPNNNIYLCALNNNGSPFYYSTRNFSFFSIGSGLTDADTMNLGSIVQSFQSILGRAI